MLKLPPSDTGVGRILRILALAALYFVAGKLGLMLALPPGYATVIWPPSGLAAGVLILYGSALWPGIALGSFVLNLTVAAQGGTDLTVTAFLSAAGIAAGSTFQALIARALVLRFLGFPLALRGFRDGMMLLVLSGPVACMMAATAGVATLYLTGVLPVGDMVDNWLTWWAGDMLGVIVFMPLVLIAPGNENGLRWRGRLLQPLSVLSLLMLTAPLGLTFYAWKVASEQIYEQAQEEFEALAHESERSLIHRVESYGHVALAAAGFFEGSESVSREEWHRYVGALQLRRHFPAISTISWVEPLALEQLPDFTERMRRSGLTDFSVRPFLKNKPLYVITHLEPDSAKRTGLGLNIAFEETIQRAAELARETKKTAISNLLPLTLDRERSLGLTLFHPVYHQAVEAGIAPNDGFRGWVSTSLVATQLFETLTQSQSRLFHIKIYDQGEETPARLIYDSNNGSRLEKPLLTIRKTVQVMQHKWLVVWSSTRSYEQLEVSDYPLFILTGGLLFTVLTATFLMALALRHPDAMRLMGEDRKLIVPIFILLLSLAGSVAVYQTLKSREQNFVISIVSDEAQKIEQLLEAQSTDKLMAFRRMAQRWNKAGGLPDDLWRDDARNYVEQIHGLHAVQWIGPDRKLRHSVPEATPDMFPTGFTTNPDMTALLAKAASRQKIVTALFDEVTTDTTGFVVCLPLYAKGRFDGFIVGIFDMRQFLDTLVSDETTTQYSVRLIDKGRLFYQTGEAAGFPEYLVERQVRAHDTDWTLQVEPTRDFLRSHKTYLPGSVLLAGLLVGSLLAIAIHSNMVSGIRAWRLAESNMLRESILASTGHLVIATDPMGRVLLMNLQAERILQEAAGEIIHHMIPRRWLKPEELVSRAYELSGILGEAVEPDFSVFAKGAAHFGLYIKEWNFVRRDGATVPIRLSITPIRNTQGEIFGFLGVGEDITQIKVQQEALKTSEETFRSAIEYASIGMALVSPEGDWLKVNGALCRMLGYTERELLAIDFQSVTHPDDLAGDLFLVQQILWGEIDSYQLEKRYLHKDGRTVWAELAVSLVRNPDGSPRHFIAQIQDIGERKEMERLKNEFVSTVSHELRTPLTSIRGALGLIEGTMAGQLPEQAAKLITLAYKNSERLILLINDILDLEKIASGKMSIDIKPENLSRLLQQAIDSNQPYATKYNVSFKLEPVNDAFEIETDSGRFLQIMANLLSNAAKFSPEGGVVSISAAIAGDRVRIAVADRGPGIPDEFRGRIFSKFAQADSSVTRQKGGTGLGLNISRELVERMGGRIGFDSTKNKGATFWFELPLRGVTQSVSPAVSPDRPVPAGDLPVVLHIEDDSDLTHLLASALAGRAHVVSAPTLADAKQAIRQDCYTLIVLDIGMPEGSGLGMIAEIRALCATPIIILSASDVSDAVRDQVAAALVKSRVPETQIIDIILSHLTVPGAS